RTLAQIGPLATVVYGTSTGKSSPNDSTTVDRMMVASARVVSSLAKCSPMHDRDPAANGTNCQRLRPADASGPNRSGSNANGLLHNAGSRWMAWIPTATTLPAA